jgi:zinc/manganese transport system substrate-binding protein
MSYQFKTYLSLRLLGGLAAIALVASSCGTASTPSADPSLSIVVTTSVLGDLVRRVVADTPDVAVAVLMAPGQDPHSFEPSAAQAARMQSADLIVINGLGLEEGLLDIVDAAKSEGAAVFEVAAAVEPLALSVPHDAAAASDDGDVGAADPHVWLDPLRMREAVIILGEMLGAADPERANIWSERARIIAGELSALHEELLGIVAELPPEKRILISNHEALGAFADRYGFEVVATVIPSASTMADPSPRDIELLVAQIEEHNVSAVFAETTARSDVLKSVVADLGRPVQIVELYTGALGAEGSAAETYSSMMLSNARLIVDSLNR